MPRSSGHPSLSHNFPTNYSGTWSLTLVTQQLRVRILVQLSHPLSPCLPDRLHEQSRGKHRGGLYHSHLSPERCQSHYSAEDSLQRIRIGSVLGNGESEGLLGTPGPGNVLGLRFLGAPVAVAVINSPGVAFAHCLGLWFLS